MLEYKNLNEKKCEFEFGGWSVQRFTPALHTQSC